jgi:phosphopantetheinyl transferase
VTASIHWAFRAAESEREASLAQLAQLTRAERARLAGLAAPKRRADFLLGRCTAKAAVAAALREACPGDWAPAAIELPARPSGAPYARLAPEAAPVPGFAPGEPLPVSVTISHAEGHALCAATFTGAGAPGGAIGIDLGRIEPRSPGLQATFFTPAERRWVAAAPAGEADLRANLVWCAKEAALKALGLGLTVDTLALTCLPEEALADPAGWPLVPEEPGWRRLEIACAPALRPGGAPLRGIWCTFGGFVGALAAADPPAPVEEGDRVLEQALGAR